MAANHVGQRRDKRSLSTLAPAQFPLQIVKLVPKPFDGDDWLFKIKHDGFRILAIRDGASNDVTCSSFSIRSRKPLRLQQEAVEVVARRISTKFFEEQGSAAEMKKRARVRAKTRKAKAKKR